MFRPTLCLSALVVLVVSCATAEDDGLDPSGGGGSGGAFGGSGGGITSGGSGGTGAVGGTGGSSATGGSGGGSGGLGGLGGVGGLDGSAGDAGQDAPTDAPPGDAPNPTGFGACVTQAEIDSQGGPFVIGFCPNPFACFLCPDEAENPGDVVCSPTCMCVPLPPLCTDGGADASDAADDGDAPGDASDAATDVSATD